MSPSSEDRSTRSNEFFRASKFLTVSSQLHLEAFIHEHPQGWTLSPTFRAEKSDTPRHLSEFYMLEAELRTNSLHTVMNVVENMIRTVMKMLQTSQLSQELLASAESRSPLRDGSMSNQVEILERRWQGLLRGPWPTISYSEAIATLRAAFQAKQTTFQYEPLWHQGLQLEHEKFLTAEVGQGSPVFITHYPRLTKPFYMLPSDQDNNHLHDEQATVACFDLLLPEMCEVVGGSLREHRLPPLLQSMEEHGLMSSLSSSSSAAEAGNLDWYVDLRRYGSIPHGGFGLGFDRLLGFLAGVDNVKDVTPWPRYFGRCEC